MMINKWLMAVLIILSIGGRAVYAQLRLPVELELSGFNYISPVPVYLSEDDKRWLQQKKSLRVAVYEPVQPPLVMTTLTGRYRGMNADYLALIQHSLNTRISVMAYPDQADAVEALKKGEVDMVLTGLESQSWREASVQVSLPLIHSWPNLVTSLGNVMAPLQSAQRTGVAIVNHYPDVDFIRQSFPDAEIDNYGSYQEALNSVNNGRNAWFFGDSLTTSTWLSQEFSLALTTVKYWPAPQRKSYFLFLPAQQRLREIVNNTLSAIDENIHGQIAQSMIDKGNLSFLIEPLDLTPREKQWLNNHKTLRVIINPWFAPYTMVDGSQQTRGIVGDVLNLIGLQTGIQFETVVVKSNKEMVAEMKKGNWHIVQAATYDLSREDYLSFTHPFITTQFVAVIRKEESKEHALRPGNHVAISADHTLLATLKAKYSGIVWEEVENSSVALNLVATGKVDAAISNQLTARYLSEHYYPDQLSWIPLTGEEPAAISFAVPRSEPELRQILDKALDDIPQKEVLQIVSKWIRLPDVKIDTWELYNRPFYLVATLASLLVLSTLLWAVYLVREVRIRKRSQRLLQEERNRALRANEEKREFLSHMSHEIRTPVSAIMGFLELLQFSPAKFSPEDKASVDQAAQASRSLLKLIGEILDLEKIESGLLETVPQWKYPDSLIQDSIALFSALAAQKGIALRYDSRLEAREAMRLDPQLLGQVLTNIIGNAVKFTERGDVRISAVKHEQTLVISVRDSGPGMSEEEQRRLFTAFSQGIAGEHHRGSGLGLAISRGLMRQMGGTIELQSEVNRGTTVTLSLPVQTSFDITPTVADVDAPLPVLQGTTLRVLIADDLPFSRLLLKRQLMTLGIIADEADNGEIALHYLQQGNYDLLITDLNMPVMDGIELARQVRKSNTTLVIWGLTATAQEHERERCLSAGMNACLFKPITLSQLSHLLSGVSDTHDTAFDLERLAMLAQGNRALMLRALKDAQEENRCDLTAAYNASESGDYRLVKHHIHRINGTAQLLGVETLMKASQSLEDKLPDAMTVTELPAELEYIQTLLDELEQAIEKFTP
ncbi:aerobic respiration control sensor protein ArcB [Citrobacter amalonaticus]|uniref:transporter substrate-binding domain-containing protein n=1 Tax=Citrobacter amalonaticus TaxID=35703 RepID=UPI000E14FC9E|nr:transporter substrate-binding domain-containing protein [Citrobacter amalonaticus]UBI19115.1 transporter substrate-binding domain-containing protein [Citrobacter amalonaticus]SUX68643.1 aerobic respiration control sensor protein ArcB [Citrobacter amalonaticus]